MATIEANVTIISTPEHEAGSAKEWAEQVESILSGIPSATSSAPAFGAENGARRLVTRMTLQTTRGTALNEAAANLAMDALRDMQGIPEGVSRVRRSEEFVGATLAKLLAAEAAAAGLLVLAECAVVTVTGMPIALAD